MDDIMPTHRGFTTLFAVLIASLLLAVGIAIFDITVKQVIFSTIVRDSNAAIYAADTGVECALYWDFKCTLSACTGAAGGSAFATSSSSHPPSSGVLCSGDDISAAVAAPAEKATAATTTFTLSFPALSGTSFAAVPYCADITVVKWGSPVNTQIIARGHNTCNPGDANRIERALQVNY